MNDAERRRSVFERLLAQEGIGAPLADRIVPRDASLRAPLSFAQETLWLLDRASPGMTAYNSAVARRVHGVLDSTALRSALDGLAARHEALRTVVDAAGDQPTLDVRPAAAVPLALADLRSQPPAKREGAAHAWLRALADTPFDLTRDLPLRAGLAQVADDEYVFLLLTHHIASDAWSYGIMFRELTALYDAARAQKAAELPSPALQFADYAVWQRATLRGDRLERALSFWRERLAALPQLELPTDRPRSSVPAADGARCALTLPPTSLGGMQRLAHSHGATLYAVLLAAYAAVLHRIGGGEEVVVGSAVAGRTRRDLEEIVGYFSAALPMRIDFAGEPTFADVLRRTMDVTVSAFEHQNVPLEEVIAGMPGKFSRPEAPLFRAVLTMQDAMSESLRLGDATTEAFEIEGAQTKFDLTLLGTEKPDGLELSLWYRTDLFEATTARHLLARLHQVLESAVRDPRQRICALNLLLPVEREQLTAWNATTCRVGAYRTVPEGIAAAAARVPAATAVVCGEDRLTYAQLTSAAQRLGRRLRGAGVAPGDAVGLYLERSVEGIVAMLAAWDVGAAYVPLAIDVPVQRTLSQLAEGRITTVVTTASLLRDVPDTVRGIALDDEGRRDAGTRDVPADGAEAADSERRTCRPDDVAYVLFTSGSTGVPKGVAVTHGNLANYTQAILATLGVNDDAPLAFASVSPLSADLGNTAIFPALCSGGTLHIIRADVTTDAARFTSYAQRHPYDVLKITPSHLGALLDGATTATLLPRRTLVLGGEACAWELIERVRTLGRCDIVNHYGPTETTIGACTFAVDDQSFGGFVPATVPIGMPLANVHCYVLDGGGQPVPIGVPGELYVGGAGVARGYVHRPELTAERFRPDPFAHDAGARMYRSGDRVRRLPTGDLEFLGRLDGQVKVRGYRVELGEIESVLRQNAAVAACAVTVSGRRDDDQPALAAYVVLRDETTANDAVEQLNTWLAERLPDYMRPQTVVPLERLPLTASGKLDRSALAHYTRTEQNRFVAPRTPTEAGIAEVWADVLKRDRVGVTDDFLALGGHSILAIRVLGKLARRFGVRLSLRTLFDARTVEALAREIDTTVRSEPRALPVP